jgi:hypothetical protein
MSFFKGFGKTAQGALDTSIAANRATNDAMVGRATAGAHPGNPAVKALGQARVAGRARMDAQLSANRAALAKQPQGTAQ